MPPVTPTPASPLARLAQAQVAKGIGRDRLSLGLYVLGIKKMWQKKSSKNGHNLIIVSFKVEEATATDPNIAPTPVGATRSTTFDLEDQYGYGINDFAGLIAAVEGAPVLGDALVQTAIEGVDEKQMLRGVAVRAEVTHKANAKDPADPFTKIAFGHVPSDDAAIARRAAAYAAEGD